MLQILPHRLFLRDERSLNYTLKNVFGTSLGVDSYIKEILFLMSETNREEMEPREVLSLV